MKKKYFAPNINIIEIHTTSIMETSLYADPTTSTSSQYSKQFNTLFDDDADEACADSHLDGWQ